MPPALAKSLPNYSKFDLPLLDDNSDDYIHWSNTVTLEYRGLWDIVYSSTPSPNANTDAVAYQEWRRCDKEAHLQLILSLSHAPHNYVLDAQSSKDVWDLLKTRYQSSGELCSYYLLKCLFITLFLDSKPMEPQIANLLTITHQLSNLKFPMTDNWVTGLIKVKLPASCKMLKTVLTNTEEGKLTSKGVIGQILAEEHRRIRTAGGDATIYYAKSSGKGKKKDNGKKCSHCKRKGHDVSECHTLKQEQEEKAAGSTPKSSTFSSGKASNGKSSGKASSKNTSKGSSGYASTKVAAADTNLDDSDETI
jgi:hypothetical protein